MLDPEYVRRMGGWFNDRSSNSCVFDEGEEVEVFDANEILTGTDKTDTPYPTFAKEAAKHFGEQVKTEGGEGKLIGISYTYTDFYYIIECLDKSRYYETCVSPIKFLEDSENNLDD